MKEQGILQCCMVRFWQLGMKTEHRNAANEEPNERSPHTCATKVQQGHNRGDRTESDAGTAVSSPTHTVKTVKNRRKRIAQRLHVRQNNNAPHLATGMQVTAYKTVKHSQGHCLVCSHCERRQVCDSVLQIIVGTFQTI